MGDIRPDNDGGMPPEDARFNDLPAFPPEWGTIVIPDDASELDDEAEALRRERSSLPSLRLSPSLRLPPPGVRSRLHPVRGAGTSHPEGDGEPQSLRVPVIIMIVAVLTTLVSLLVVAQGQRPVDRAPDPPRASSAQRTTTTAGPLGEITLVDPTGVTLRLATLLPALIVIVDGCDCAPLVLDLAAAVPAGVTVIAAGNTPPVIYGAPTHVRSLAAAADSPLRTRWAGTSPPAATVGAATVGATVIVMNRQASVLAVIPHARTVADVAPLDPQ